MWLDFVQVLYTSRYPDQIENLKLPFYYYHHYYYYYYYYYYCYYYFIFFETNYSFIYLVYINQWLLFLDFVKILIS